MALMEAEEEQLVYQRIAEEAIHFRRLGFSDSNIAWLLDVDDKTVAKAIRWRNLTQSACSRRPQESMPYQPLPV